MIDPSQRRVPDAHVSCVGGPRLASAHISSQSLVLFESMVPAHWSGSCTIRWVSRAHSDEDVCLGSQQ